LPLIYVLFSKSLFFGGMAKGLSTVMLHRTHQA